MPFLARVKLAPMHERSAFQSSERDDCQIAHIVTRHSRSHHIRLNCTDRWQRGHSSVWNADEDHPRTEHSKTFLLVCTYAVELEPALLCGYSIPLESLELESRSVDRNDTQASGDHRRYTFQVRIMLKLILSCFMWLLPETDLPSTNVLQL